MEYLIVYLVLGCLCLLAYRVYFKNEPPVISLGRRETEVAIVTLWLPLLVIVGVCAITAAVVDYRNKPQG